MCGNRSRSSKSQRTGGTWGIVLVVSWGASRARSFGHIYSAEGDEKLSTVEVGAVVEAVDELESSASTKSMV